MDTQKFVWFSPFARGAYGVDNRPLQVGAFVPALTTGYQGDTRPTGFLPESSSFRASAYKDPNTGRYVVAIAGTNDLRGDALADGALGAQDLAMTQWHAEMTDAVRFTAGVFEQIRAELRISGIDNPTMDDIRSRVEVTGHSLGGALSELVSQFFGLPGYNLDGPGVSRLLGSPNYIDLKHEVRASFPDLAESYSFDRAAFSADAFSVIGVAGEHPANVMFEALPRARLAFNAAVSVVGAGALLRNIPIALLGLGVAGTDAGFNHPMGRITSFVEEGLGLSAVVHAQAAKLLLGEYPSYASTAYYQEYSSSAIALGVGLKGLADEQARNVSVGLSPSGYPMSGLTASDGAYSLSAHVDPTSGHIVEVRVPLAGGQPVERRFIVDADGNIGRIDPTTGNAIFIAELAGTVSLVSVGPMSFAFDGVNVMGRYRTTSLPASLSGTDVLEGRATLGDFLAVIFSELFPAPEPPARTILQGSTSGSKLAVNVYDDGSATATGFDSAGDEIGQIPLQADGEGGFFVTLDIGNESVKFHGVLAEDGLNLDRFVSINGQAPTFLNMGNAALSALKPNFSDLVFGGEDIGNAAKLTTAVNPGDADGVEPIPTVAGGPAWFASGDPRVLATEISSLTGLIAAIDSGNPLHIATNAFNVAASALPGEWAGDSAGALNAITGLINFKRAVERGDMLAAVSGGGGVLLTAIKSLKWVVEQQIVANWLNLETAHVAAAAGDASAQQLVAQYEALDGAATAIGQDVLPVIGAIAGVIGALDSEHPNYADAVMSVVALIPFYGPIIYAAYQGGKVMHALIERKWGGTAADLLVGPDEPIELFNDTLAHIFGTEWDIHAEGEFASAGDGRGLVVRITGQEDGGERVLEPTMNSLLQLLDAALQADPSLGYVARRMPKLSYRAAAEGDTFTLSWVDRESGATVSRTFDRLGLLAVGVPGDETTLASADSAVAVNGGELANSPAFHASLAQAFLWAVQSSAALVPSAEVRSADIQASDRWVSPAGGEPAQWIGADPLAGLSAIERARAQGQLLANDPGDAASAGADGQQAVHPIVLDFGAGYTIGRRDNGLGVLFDVDDDGYAEQTDWVGPRTSMLVIDRDGDGQISTGHELFSDSVVDMAARGLSVLSELDANGDGKLTQGDDPLFESLRIWQDINGDGVMQPHEERRLGTSDVWDPAQYSGVLAIDIAAGTFSYLPLLDDGGGFEAESQTGQLRLADLQAAAAGVITLSNGNVVPVNWETGERTSLTRAVFDTAYAPDAPEFAHTSDDGSIRVYDRAMDGFEDSQLVVSVVQLVDQPTAGSHLNFVSLGASVGGSAVLDSAKGVVTFTPEPNYSGIASIAYTMADDTGRQVSAQALIALAPVNDNPVVVASAYSRAAHVGDYQLINWSGGDAGTASSCTLTDGAMLGEVLPGSATVATLDYTVLFGTLGYLGLDEGTLAWRKAGSTSWQRVIIGDAHQGSLVATDVETAAAALTFKLVEDGRYGKSNFDVQTGTWNYEYEGYGGADDAFIVEVADADGGKTRQRIIVVNPNAVAPDWDTGGDAGAGAGVGAGAGGDGDWGTGGGIGPVVLDLGVDGIQYISVRNSAAFFDFTGDGIRERVGWIAGTDAFLAYDADGDGRIDQRGELVFKDLLPGAQTDLQGLAALDANGDGLLSAADPMWSRLMTWQDRNENGIQDAGEVAPLGARGIRSISLTTAGGAGTVAGTTVHGVGTFTRIDGSTGQLADVSLRVSDEVFSVTPDDTVVAPALGGVFDTGTGNDRIRGGDGVDEVHGGAGNDHIAGGADADILFGNSGADLIAGDEGNDALSGGYGNDTLYGGAGNDTLGGHQGDDVLYGGDDDDQLGGHAGMDLLDGGAGDDAMFGGDGADQLFGGSGHDGLDGGAGGDQMRGGSGNDVYRVDSALDVVAESAGDGIDTVLSTVDVEGYAGVETVVLVGAQPLKALGTLGDDHLFGNQADNLLDPGTGADDMAGGAGDDTYVVDNPNDTVVELADGAAVPEAAPAFDSDNALRADFFNAEGHAGFNGSTWGIDSVLSSVSWTLGPNVENLTLTGVAAIEGTGNALSNVVTGNAIDNVLAGGLGDDRLIGGAGYDTYRFDRGDGQDRIDDAAGGGQIGFGAGIAWSDLALQMVGNDLVITLQQAGQATGDRITLADWATRSERVATVRFADGAARALTIDTTPPATNHAPTVAQPIPDGVASVGRPLDVTVAAATFVDGDAGDVLTLSARQADGLALPDWLGFDAGTARFSGTPPLAWAGRAIDLAVTATDSAGASVSDVFRIDLQSAGLTLVGTADADVLTGAEYDDTLIGNAGNDTVDGGGGFDTYRFARGDGADRLIDAAQGGRIVFGTGIGEADLRLTREGGEAVIELLDGGTPTGDRITLVDWTPGSDRITRLEFADGHTLTLAQDLFNSAPVLDDDGDSGTEDVVTLTGNVLANDTDPDAADILRVANAGVFEGDWGRLELADGGTWVYTPSTAAQSLAAGQTASEQFDIAVVDRIGSSAITRHSTLTITLAGSNDAPVLTGSLADTSAAIRRVMSIALPADLFSDVDSGDTLTWSVRLAGGAALPAWMSVDMATRTLTGAPPDAALDTEWTIEVSVADGSGGSANTSFKVAINAQGLTLTGTEGADALTGTDLNDTLIGHGGADILDGKEGQDQMSGGSGDDRYAVDHASDTVNEVADGGNDTVVATISALLGNHLENLMLVGPDSIDGTGNALDNVLVGNVAANTLAGLAGNDALAGGQGDDVLDGGSGDDLYLYHQGEGREILRDQAGTDTLRFGAGITLDSVVARELFDDGHNAVGVKVSVLGSDGSEDTSQTIEWATGTTIERFEFVDGSVKTLADLLLGTQVANGTNGNDTLSGGRNDDFLYGGNGNDSVRGYTGNDWLEGGNGTDKLIADGGDDTLRGGNESDELWGGAGNDVLEGGNGADLLGGGAGNDLLLGGNDADRLDGGDGNDLLDGLNGQDDLYAGAGNDTLDGGNDADVLAAGAGDDKVTAGNGRDAIVAGAGNDDVQSGNDGDFIDAGAGNDVIASGNGVDFVAPGQGNDTIDAGADHDIIAFNRGDGADVIRTSSWQRDTLSLGGGIRYADLRLRRDGNDLVMGLGNGDSITLQGWYVDNSRRNVTTLQVVTGAVGGDYLAASSDRLLNQQVVSFNFESLVNRFDQWSSANPGHSEWAPAAELDTYYVAGNNTAAIGGNLAWRYATSGSYGDIDGRGAIDRMASIGATNWQSFTASSTVDPWTALQAGTLMLSDPTVGLPSPITPALPPSSNELFFAAINAGGHKPDWVGTTPSPVLP